MVRIRFELFHSNIKLQKQVCDSNQFFHIKLSFRLGNVKNISDRVDCYLKSIVKSILITKFAEILQDPKCNDNKNRI